MNEQTEKSQSGKQAVKDVGQYVEQRIMNILSMPEGGPQRAILAKLRRGIGKAPGELPALWGVLFDEDFPAKWMNDKGAASHEEWAVYISLTVFALHQQSKSTKTLPMHQKGQTLGRALRRLAGSDENARERISRRFQQMATESNMLGVTHYLRGLVQLLRTESIPLDYAALARDLYQYQNINWVASVRLRWAQDFYRMNLDEQENGKDE